MANPIPPRLPRAPIPAFGLLGPAGAPPLRPGPTASSEISKSLPPNSIAPEDKSSLPTSYREQRHEYRIVSSVFKETIQHTVKLTSSIIASPESTKTSTFLTGASFSNACCRSGSWVSSGRFLTRKERAAASWREPGTLNSERQIRCSPPQLLGIRHLFLMLASARMTANRRPFRSWLFTASAACAPSCTPVQYSFAEGSVWEHQPPW
jgi:hypothetical protein